MDPNNSQPPTIAGAITYPARGDRQMLPIPNQPRQPRNLQGLLRFAMEATKAEDAPGESQLGPMDEERRRFLAEALKSMTVDLAEILQKAIKVLSDQEKIQSINHGEDLPGDVEEAFTNVLEIVDDIDIANDFYKMGGFAVFPVCYGSDNEKVRARASAILAELCQNNPFCQARALECGLMDVVVKLIETERGVALTKSISALSCMSRGFPPGTERAVSGGACAALCWALRAGGPGGAGGAGQESDAGAVTKAAFLLEYLTSQVPAAREQLISQNIVKTLCDLIMDERNNATEHLLSTLLALAETRDPVVLQQCRDPALNLQKVLEDHIKHPDVQTMFIEEKEYAQSLLKIVFQEAPKDVCDESVDR